MVIAAALVLFVLRGQPPSVLGPVAGLAAVALVVSIAQGVAAGDSDRRRAELSRAQRRLREVAQTPSPPAAPAAAAAQAAAPGQTPSPAAAGPSVPAPPPAERRAAAELETALAESRSDVAHLRGEIQRLQQREREGEDKLRAATGAATIAAEDRKRLDAALKDSRAEVERLKKELESARRAPAEAGAVAGAPRAEPPRAAAAPAPAAAPARPAAAPAPSRPAPPPMGPPLAPRPAAPAPAAVPQGAPLAPVAPQGPPLSPVAPPLASAPAAAPAPPPSPRAADGPASGTLLLVDDDPDFLTVAALTLRRAGYEVIEASGGAAALEAVQRHPGSIDLLITDMMMPGMNGRQLAQRFAQLRRGVRVLYVSGVVDEASAREAIAGENADFLEKPFEGDAFTGKVRDLLPAARRR